MYSLNPDLPVPLYRQLVEQIISALESGTIKNNEKLPTEYELVNQYGISRNTVRKAFDTLEFNGYIKRLPGKGTYAVEKKIRNLSKKKILVFTGSINQFDTVQDPWNWNLKRESLNGIYQKASEYSLGIEICNFFNCDRDIVSTVIGYIFFSIPDEETTGILNFKGLPYCVLLSSPHVRADIRSVICTDSALETYLAIIQLISKGKKNIAFVGPLFNALDKKISGYTQALVDRNIRFDSALTFNSAAGSMEEGFAAGVKLLESGVRINAIFCATDTRAFGVIRSVLEKGLRIPEDIAVMGYDDIEECVNQSPALTTVRVPRLKKGIAAVQKVIDWHQAGAQYLPEITTLRGEIIFRGSV